MIECPHCHTDLEGAIARVNLCPDCRLWFTSTWQNHTSQAEELAAIRQVLNAPDGPLLKAVTELVATHALLHRMASVYLAELEEYESTVSPGRNVLQEPVEIRLHNDRASTSAVIHLHEQASIGIRFEGLLNRHLDIQVGLQDDQIVLVIRNYGPGRENQPQVIELYSFPVSPTS